MERVSEYQVFHLPYMVDFPGNSLLQVFPEMQKLPVKEVIRIEEGNEAGVSNEKSRRALPGMDNHIQGKSIGG